MIGKVGSTDLHLLGGVAKSAEEVDVVSDGEVVNQAGAARLFGRNVPRAVVEGRGLAAAGPLIRQQTPGVISQHRGRHERRFDGRR